MTQNEIDIIKREVAVRLPYGLMVKYDLGNSYPYPKIGRVYLWHHNDFCSIYMVDKYPENWFLPIKIESACRWESVKPYLRPMNTMTEDEKKKLLKLLFGKKDAELFKVAKNGTIRDKDDKKVRMFSSIDNVQFRFVDFNRKNISAYMTFMYERHLDVNGLIKKKLALPAPDGMYFSETGEPCNK